MMLPKPSAGPLCPWKMACTGQPPRAWFTEPRAASASGAHIHLVKACASAIWLFVLATPAAVKRNAVRTAPLAP
jgi:hypothetical protein